MFMVVALKENLFLKIILWGLNRIHNQKIEHLNTKRCELIINLQSKLYGIFENEHFFSFFFFLPYAYVFRAKLIRGLEDSNPSISIPIRLKAGKISTLPNRLETWSHQKIRRPTDKH